jgi:hypothetical protein
MLSFESFRLMGIQLFISGQRIPLAASLFADCLEETEEEVERSFIVQTAETAAQA